MTNINEVGKFLRILRLEHSETLKDMADRLGCAPTYLSGIENSKRETPKNLHEKVVAVYGLDEARAAELKVALLRSRSSFRIENDGTEAKKAVLVKMSNNELAPEQYAKILEMLQSDEE